MYNFSKKEKKTIISNRMVNHLYVWFLSYLPESIICDPNKLLSHLQEVYWFYLDYVLSVPNEMCMISFLSFTYYFYSFFGWKKNQVKEYVHNFQNYCSALPRCGGILINTDKTKVLLIRNIQSSYWEFPVGKLNDQEDFMECAEREVFEETGFHGQCSFDMILFQKNKGKKADYRLFMFYNVPEDYDFTPQTRNEIAEIKWVNIEELPTILNPKVFSDYFFGFLTEKVCNSQKTRQHDCIDGINGRIDDDMNDGMNGGCTSMHKYIYHTDHLLYI